MDKINEQSDVALWKTTLVTYEGLPLALRVRPSIDTPDNRTAFPNLVVITHKLAQVKSTGLPADDYNESLFSFDRELQAAVSGEKEGIVFVVETFSGNRNYYGCVHDLPAAQTRIDQVCASCPQHKLTVMTRAAKAWNFYQRYREQFHW
jgi:hypothetical protein